VTTLCKLELFIKSLLQNISCDVWITKMREKNGGAEVRRSGSWSKRKLSKRKLVEGHLVDYIQLCRLAVCIVDQVAQCHLVDYT
jgi:hypothetical protein